MGFRFAGARLDDATPVRVGVILFCIFACSPMAMRGQVIAPPATIAPLTAQSAGSPMVFPDAASFGFEDASTTTFTYYGTMVPPANQWASWTMNGSSGIAANGSGFTSLNPNAPEGTHVAFLQGAGSISTTVTFSAGTWRLRFKGAQRQRPTSVNHQVVRVSIGGIVVDETDFSGTSYQDYTTRPIRVDVPTSMSVVLTGLNPDGGDNTGFIDDVRVEPISEWNDPATWGGFLPSAATPTIIPSGVEVAVLGTSNVAKNVSVTGELLVANRDADLSAEWVMVSGVRARFEVGRPATPFLEDFTLTLTASPTSPPAAMGGTKFLIAMNGGVLDVHGKPKVTWTKLNVTANPNDASITLADPVNWEQGDEIVIAGTKHQRSTNGPFSPNNCGALVSAPNYVDYAEKKRVSSVSPNGLIVTLDTSPTGLGAIVHQHHGGAPQSYSSQGKTWTLDQRAEVGLLTHNVKIQGNAASDTQEFGGHIMVMRPTGTTVHGSAYISGVELHRMGQKQVLGRYPMHWHVMLNLAQGQYFRDSSVHRSYNRGITIHGTDYVDVARNVVYDTVGHAVFLEDGSEQFNTITGNLVLSTVKPAATHEMLCSDNELEQLQNRTPASFWITNPNNEVNGNVAAGTEGTGFWFIFPTTPTGLSGTDPDAVAYFAGRFPYQGDLGSFDGNVCHSSGSGFDVNDSIWFNDPNHPDHAIRTNVPWNPSGPEVLTNFTVYGCDMGIYAGIGNEKIFFDHCVIADNNENIRLAAYHTVQNSVVIAGTGNFGGVSGGQRGYVVYDGAGRMKDSYFVDFDQNATWTISGSGAATLHTNHLFSGITHRYTTAATLPTVNFSDFASAVDSMGNPVNTNCFDAQNLADPRKWGMAVRDVDGSVWGVAGSTLIGNHPLQHIPSADITPANAPTSPLVPNEFARLSPFRFGHFRILHPGFNPSNLPDVTMQRGANGAFPGTIPFPNCFHTDIHKQWPVIVQSDFFYVVNWTQSPLPMNSIIATLDDVETQDSLFMVLGGIGAQPALAVTNATQVFSILALRNATSTSYMVLGNDVAIKYAGVNKRVNVTLSW